MTRFVKIVMASVAAATVPMHEVQALNISMGKASDGGDNKGDDKAMADYAKTAMEYALLGGTWAYGYLPGADPEKVKKMKAFIKAAPSVAGQRVSLGTLAGCSSGCWVGNELKIRFIKAGGILAFLYALQNGLGFVNADVNEVKERAPDVEVVVVEQGENVQKGSLFAFPNKGTVKNVQKGKETLPVFNVSKTSHGCNMSEGDVVIAYGENEDDMKRIAKDTTVTQVNAGEVKYWEVEGKVNRFLMKYLDRNGDGQLSAGDGFTLIDEVVAMLTGKRSAGTREHAEAMSHSQGCGYKCGFIVGLGCGVYCGK